MNGIVILFISSFLICDSYQPATSGNVWISARPNSITRSSILASRRKRRNFSQLFIRASHSSDGDSFADLPSLLSSDEDTELPREKFWPPKHPSNYRRLKEQDNSNSLKFIAKYERPFIQSKSLMFNLPQRNTRSYATTVASIGDNPMKLFVDAPTAFVDSEEVVEVVDKFRFVVKKSDLQRAMLYNTSLESTNLGYMVYPKRTYTLP